MKTKNKIQVLKNCLSDNDENIRGHIRPNRTSKNTRPQADSGFVFVTIAITQMGSCRKRLGFRPVNLQKKKKENWKRKPMKKRLPIAIQLFTDPY